jgi:hypothetical protein
MESTIGLFKTELIKPRRPWKTLSDVELATAEWVDWYNYPIKIGQLVRRWPATALESLGGGGSPAAPLGLCFRSTRDRTLFLIGAPGVSPDAFGRGTITWCAVDGTSSGPARTGPERTSRHPPARPPGDS